MLSSRQGNKIAFLTGVPASVRSLLLASNSLTSVSSFGHLSNLERLDISHNRIESVQRAPCLASGVVALTFLVHRAGVSTPSSGAQSRLLPDC